MGGAISLIGHIHFFSSKLKNGPLCNGVCTLLRQTIFQKKFAIFLRGRKIALYLHPQNGFSSVAHFTNNAEIAQLVEHNLAPKRVNTPTLARRAKPRARKTFNAEIAQLVEHNLAKVGVASSSLVFRSKSSLRVF